MIKLNNQHVGDYIWRGQVEYRIEEEIPSTYLRKDTNRLLVQAFASATEGRDQTLFNFFAIDYRRRFTAWPGYLRFKREPSTGTQFVVLDFSHPEVHLFDTAREIVFSGLRVDSTRAPRYTAVFEDENGPGPSTSSSTAPVSALPGARSIPLPGCERRIRGPTTSSSPTKIFSSRPTGSPATAGRTAWPRKSSESSTSTHEFSHGLMRREAIGDFISFAYHNWERPPQYVLLLGDATFDYRNRLGGGHPSYVPTLYYDARRRGLSPSDYLFTLVDGDDLLPDIAIGRLAAESPVEAEGVVDKIIRYDTEPAPGDWRSRVIYLANYHAKNEFTRPSDELAARFSEPFGLQSVKIYNPDEQHLPNPTGKAFLDALNAGALLVNFNGHGAAGTMQYLFSLQFPDWDYLSKVDNGRRLPLVTALSCLNGMFVNPHTEAIGEVFTDRAEGGSIGYISASAHSFTSQNDLLGKQLYGQFFTDGTLAFGPALNAAKVRVLAAHPSWTASALTMQLFGDPAQELALPRLPDYQARQLTLGEELLSGSTVPVAAVLANNTRATRDSVTVLVAIRGGATDDTLFFERLAPFVGSRPISFDWPIGARRGEHLLEVAVDPDELVAELDEGNNAAAVAVDILSPVVPELLFPAGRRRAADFFSELRGDCRGAGETGRVPAVDRGRFRFRQLDSVPGGPGRGWSCGVRPGPFRGRLVLAGPGRGRRIHRAVEPRPLAVAWGGCRGASRGAAALATDRGADGRQRPRVSRSRRGPAAGHAQLHAPETGKRDPGGRVHGARPQGGRGARYRRHLPVCQALVQRFHDHLPRHRFLHPHRNRA